MEPLSLTLPRSTGIPGGRGLLPLLWLLLLLAAMPAGVAGAEETGVVGSRDGTSTSGRLQFRDGAVEVTPEAGGAPKTVTLDSLLFFRIQRLGIPEVALASGERRGLVATSFAEGGFLGAGAVSAAPDFGKPGDVLSYKRSGDNPASVRWEGAVVPLVSGMHSFHLRSTALARMWVSNCLVGSVMATQEVRESTLDLFLTAERRYPLVLEFSHPAGESVLEAFWSAPGIPRSPIPASRVVVVPGASPYAGISRGILGTYYGTPEFGNRRMIRVDPELVQGWGLRAPAPEMGLGNRFSVLWDGTLEVPVSDAYRIEFQTEGGLRCRLDGEIIQIRWEDGLLNRASTATFPIQIEAGHRHSLQVEFFNEVARASIGVRFWPPDREQARPFASGLRPATPPDLSVPVASGGRTNNATASTAPPGPAPAPGIWLTDGSFLAQPVESGTARAIQLQPGDFATSIPADLVSRIDLVQAVAGSSVAPDPTRAGAMMINGDFLEGDFQSMDTNTVRLSSILFGNHKVPRERVQCVVLRPPVPGAGEWSLVTQSGSALEAREIRFQESGLQLRTTLPSQVLVPYAKIAQLTRSARAKVPVKSP